jgi:hypothetical protein
MNKIVSAEAGRVSRLSGGDDGTIPALAPSNLITGKAASEQGAKPEGLARDFIVASACRAASNPHSSLHTQQAISRLLAFLIENETPAFQMPASGGDLENARLYLEEAARLLSELAFNIGRDAGFKTNRTIFSDAFHDSELRDDLCKENA